MEGDEADPGQCLECDDSDSEEWMQSGQSGGSPTSKLERLVGEIKYQDVLNLATIHKKTDASGPDTSLGALEEEEQELIVAAQEDEHGQVVVPNSAVNTPPVVVATTGRQDPGQEFAVPRRSPAPDSSLLCRIPVKRKRKTIACGERLLTYEALLTHEEEIHHLKKALVCQPCRQRFPSAKEVQAHSLRCPFNIKCPFCHSRYQNTKALRIHMDARHREASQSLSVEEHRKINGDRVCPHCNKMLARPALLKQHLERGKCVPRPVAESITPEMPARTLRKTRGHHQDLQPLGVPPLPQDGEGNIIDLPHEPLKPEHYDIVYPNAQTKEQVAAGGRGGANITFTIPMDQLTEGEVAEGGFCLAYRCGLCHLVVVSDIGALMYHQQFCKRIDLRTIDRAGFFKKNRCIWCGLTLPTFAEFFNHLSDCRTTKFDPDTFEWHGPPPPKAVRIPRPMYKNKL